MSYPWNQIEEVIERTEYERVLSELSLVEQQEGFLRKQLKLTDRTKRYLDFLGKLCVGLSVGIFTVVFNFLLFTWLLHIEVNPQAAKPFEKKFKEPSATVDHTLAQQNKPGTSEYGDKESSKEAKHAFERAAQYVEQAATWVSNTLEAGTVDVMKGARLVADKLLESANWGTEGTEEVGKGIKETGAVVSEEGFMRGKEEAQKEVNGFQQNNDPSRTVYTVQVGAFKDYSNADALKTRLIKRGYNAYVTFVGSESKERIFKLCKVWIGEFKDMENAERVSIEIEKAEGMQALVTLKEGQESIR
jgi:cell division protein FtsN